MTTEELAKQIRISSLKMCHKAKTSHIGGCLSCADILAVLYNDILKTDDKLIISKGHCAAAIYSVLALTGKIPMEWIDRYCQDGAELGGHITHEINGIEVSTGSLGHGLSIACGMALVDRNRNIFVLLSDGECDEGSTWEAIDFASNNSLHNLIAIIDYNGWKSFSEAQPIKTLQKKLLAFGWYTMIVDGHNLDNLKHRLIYSLHVTDFSPTCIIAKTVKGKGVSFLENKLESHYKTPSDEELRLALKGLR